MINKYIKFLSIFYVCCFLISCVFYEQQVPTIDNFDITISSSQLDKVQEKIILEQLLNRSIFKYNQDSEYLLKLNIKNYYRKSLVSKNINTIASNVEWIITYSLVKKTDNLILDQQKFTIIDTNYESSKIFSNFRTNEYRFNNLVTNISSFLERKLKKYTVFK